MEASVRRFWSLHKTINRGNRTECLLRCCSAARNLHSERPAFTRDCRSHGWVAQLAEQRTENPRVGGSIPPPARPHFHKEKCAIFSSEIGKFRSRQVVITSVTGQSLDSRSRFIRRCDYCCNIFARAGLTTNEYSKSQMRRKLLGEFHSRICPWPRMTYL